MNKFDRSLYNDDFFEWHMKHAHAYSFASMVDYCDRYHPKSVVDFGCGIASYLAAAYEFNASITGFDIALSDAKRFIPKHLWPFLHEADLTQPLCCAKHELVLSFETAEHIEPDGTEMFFHNLVNAMQDGGTMLFTAAPPGQDGTGHINCRPREFWVSLGELHFLKEDVSLLAELKTVWKFLSCPDYIVNNLIVFKK